MQNIFKNIADMQEHIQPLNINGLTGRMLVLPASKKSNDKKNILMIYGHHSSIERMYGIAEEFSKYGKVTMPDLPGFGGMDSFYSIDMEPSLDNLADYLATFVKLKYRNKRVTIIGMSLGFVIATRMLQRYPDLIKKVDFLVSMVGFSHHSDYTFSKSRLNFYKYASAFFSKKLPSAFFYNVCLHPSLLRAFYGKSHNAKNKFKDLPEEQKKQNMEFEVVLWRENDVRTYMSTANTMLKIDNCTKHIDLPVHHISVKGDQYFDNFVVEQHMRVIFNDFIGYEAKLPNHAPSIIASKKDAAPFVPKGIRKLLSK